MNAEQVLDWFIRHRRTDDSYDSLIPQMASLVEMLPVGVCALVSETRAVLLEHDAAKETLESVRKGLERYTGEIELPEPDDDDIAMIRKIIDRAREL
jgi:hypothetical protein